MAQTTNRREKLLSRIKEVLAEEVPKQNLLVFRRKLYSKLNARGINLYARRVDKNSSLISQILDDELDILQNEFLSTLKDFNIVTKKQKENLKKYS